MRVAAPARLAAGELVELTRHHARRFLAGDYPFVAFESTKRWHRRIYQDSGADIWLLTWLPSQGTELHDHGGSAGAFTVVAGELTELLPRTHANGAVSLVARRRRSMSTTAFGPQHVHDVVNRGRQPAVSVHAYSPPLRAMRFYEVAGGGGLTVSRTVATDEPEPEPVGQS